MKEDLSFKAVIDNDPKKQGTIFCGLPVVSYDDVKNNLPKIKIVVAKAYPGEICSFLSDRGLKENEDFFSMNDFIPRYYWAKDKTLVFRTVYVAVTNMCTMNCNGCCVYIPMAKSRKHISAESVMHNLDLFFSHIDSVMVIKITVGESILNKELPDICYRINEKYKERFGELIIETNATVLPDDEAMPRFTESGMKFALSNYPENIKNTKKFTDKCDMFNTKWYFNSEGGNRESWLDYGNPNIIKETDSEKLREHYSKCFKPGMGLHDERLYICFLQSWSHFIAEAGTLEQGDAFDLRQPKTANSRKELYKILTRQPPGQGYLSHCMRCNGTNSSL
jgi:hypothetical protein